MTQSAAKTIDCPRCQAAVDASAIACQVCGYALVKLGNDIIGQTIGNLEVVAKIAKGGMGTVYRAEHRTLRTPYAVKVLHSRFSTDATIAERFRREAMACSKLRHPNVVFVTDFGLQDGLGIYIIMEFLDGAPLAKVIKKSAPMGTGRVVWIGRQICAALQAAHDMEIVHRDLKPDNIVVVDSASQPDFVKVLDFGIAQIQESEEDRKLTRAGLVLGTPAYISPEQINGEAASVGPGADIYALGTILFEMVVGKPPFNEGSNFEILSQHMFKAPALIGHHRQDLLGSKLETLVTDTLAKKPAERPVSMSAVMERLEEAVAELKERGVADAKYVGGRDGQIAETSGLFKLTPTPMHITSVVKRIKTKPTSAAAQLLEAFPGIASLREELFHMAIWGVLHRELLDWPLDSESFRCALEQQGLMVEALLTDRGGEFPRERIFRGLADVLALADRERQKRIVLNVSKYMNHHRFPTELMPAWAQPRATGTWGAFKKIMTKEITLFGGKRAEDELDEGEVQQAAPIVEDVVAPAAPSPPSQAVQAPAPAVQPVLEAYRVEEMLAEDDDEGDELSLMGKLGQEVSLKTLKSVLTHEISFFGRRRRKRDKTEPQEPAKAAPPPPSED